MKTKFSIFLLLVIALIFIVSGCSKSDSINKDNEVSKINSPVVNNNNSSSNENSTAKTTENKNHKVIVIDPGHGGKSSSKEEPVAPESNIMKPANVSGAQGINTKITEYELNLSVSMKLKELLENNGFTVIMTRTSNAETIGNIERAEIGNKNNANLVIRIHADSNEISSIQGASMLVPGSVGYAKDISSISKKYGEVIFNTLIDEVKMESRGVVTRTDLTGFNWSKVPVVLIEMGFLSNPNEDKLLATENYQQKIAMGLSKGIKKALDN